MTPCVTGLDSELRGLKSLYSNLGGFKSPLESRTELSVDVNVERVEAKGQSGTEVDTLTTLVEDFFFLAEGRAAEDEA